MFLNAIAYFAEKTVYKFVFIQSVIKAKEVVSALRSFINYPFNPVV